MNVAVRTQHLNIISLCTGGGGLDLGVELAMPSARSVVLVEREAFAASHLVSAIQKGLMAPAAIWSDVTTFNGRPWRGIVDGLIGGIPCQPHSLAGKRLGEDDERDLWSDARRIIVQSGAWFVLIENVRGMLSSGGAERVWRDLRRLGFAVEGGLFTASEVGASHERERIFILAVANSGGHGQQWCPESNGCEIKPEQQTSRRRYAKRCDCAVGDTLRQGPHAGAHPRVYREQEGRGARHENPDGSSGSLGDALSSGHDGRSDDAIWREVGRIAFEGTSSGLGLFPPGPSDLASWRHVLDRAPELEPAVRRVANGLAAQVDVGRIDELRMLGNGVVSIQAAYALRTLVTRLAGSGSAGAAQLVRMMESAEPFASLSPHQPGGPS